MKDWALLDALRAGEAWAVETLYREYAERVLGWVIRLGGPDLDAEDVAHDVFETAIQKVSGFRGDSELSTWLFGITRNTVRNARRRAFLHRLVGMTEVPPLPGGPDPHEEVEARLRRRQVQRALDRLPERLRLVLVLVDLEQATAPEAAAVLGIPVGTIHSRLHHARRDFARALTRERLPSGEQDGDLIRLRRGS